MYTIGYSVDSPSDTYAPKMSLEDGEGEEFCERDFRGIVAGAETSIFNIKRQLQTVQTLRRCQKTIQQKQSKPNSDVLCLGLSS